VFDIILDPTFQAVFWTVVGVAVKAYAPASWPLLGVAKKLNDELIRLHDLSEEQNKIIIHRATQSDMPLAVKILNKKLG